MKKIKKVPLLMLAFLSAVNMTACGVLDELVGKHGQEATTTATTAERVRVTTTTRDYSVKGERKANTTTTAHRDDFDPEKLSRVPITSGSTTKMSNEKIKTTTTTTTTRSAFNILQSPKSDEYFTIAKGLRTSKEADVRYGPSTEYSKIKTIPAGTGFSALAQSGKWYYIAVNGSEYGWIDSSSVESAPKTTTTKK